MNNQRISTELEIQAILSSCPIAGEGVNTWLFSAARKLHRLGIEPQEIEELLEDATADCGRDMKGDEIERAVRNSHPDVLAKKAGPRRRAWSQRNYEQIEAIGLSATLAQLQKKSPLRLDGSENQAELVVGDLFPGDPLLCAGSKRSVLTRPRSEWMPFLHKQPFIVPSAMTKRKGRTQDGELSFRSLENVGPRQFVVVECDFAERDENGRFTSAAPVLQSLAAKGRTRLDLCAAIHGHLAKLRPLALVVHSGGKSLHGWYPCEGESEEVMHRFMRYAVSLGADPATWTKIQLVRMPDGVRDNGERQRIIYFNPAVLKGGAQ